MKIDESLIQHATTEKQVAAIKAYITHGSYSKASRALGIDGKTLYQHLMAVKKKAGTEGNVPELGIDKPFPDTANIAKGYSRWFKTEDGGYWVKTDVHLSERIEIARAAIDAMSGELKPIKPIKLDRQYKQHADFCNLYVLSDIHFGALSWAAETGTDWDLDIAERVVCEAFAYQIEHSPDAEHAIFCQLGDAFHYDSMRAETPTNRHIVDADSRPQKMVRVAIRVFRRVIEMLARRHKRVTVLHAQGNHDPYSTIHTQEWSSVVYENNPRIEIICNPSPYYAIVHGRTFLGFHHGHKRKLAGLLEVFNGRDYWPQKAGCRMAYIHSGHEHHRELKEFTGGIAEMHPTLCGRSSYEAQGGYQADRSMACITYHTKGYEYSRVLYYPEVSE